MASFLPSLSTKGLSNPGENNCFMNSVVQVLWHLKSFRRNFRNAMQHRCLGESCIFCALKVIFTHSTFSEREILPPNILRKALAVAFETRNKFQLGKTDDAVECLEAILEQLHKTVQDIPTAGICMLSSCVAHQCFMTQITCQEECVTCDVTSSLTTFGQNIQNVLVDALLNVVAHNRHRNFADAMRLTLKDGSDCSMCGKGTRLTSTVEHVAHIFSLSFVWTGNRQSASLIKQLLELVETDLNVTDLFDQVASDQVHCSHSLASLIFYRNGHYITVNYDQDVSRWLVVNDSQVTEVGSWTDVVDECASANMLPLLLMYETSKISYITFPSNVIQTEFTASSDNMATDNSLTDLATLDDENCDASMDDVGDMVAFENAVVSNQVEVVQQLIQKGMDPNHPLSSGETPLTYATSNRLAKLSQILVDGGADVRLHNIHGETSLYIAAEFGYVELIETLLRVGESAIDDPCGLDKMTPLSVATANNQLAAVELLIKANCDLNVRDVHGWTALWHAVNICCEPLISALANAGADFTVTDATGKSVLEKAKENGNDKIVAILQSMASS